MRQSLLGSSSAAAFYAKECLLTRDALSQVFAPPVEGNNKEEEEEETEEMNLWRSSLWGIEDAEIQGKGKGRKEERSKNLANKREKMKTLHRR